mmetsp:Transcript_10535/g.19111  ORF Transcript_10535/g.19111 Transcript_10535/m.19111 type:complete len:452 (-) Transcript_10535:71-1426(-)
MVLRLTTVACLAIAFLSLCRLSRAAAFRGFDDAASAQVLALESLRATALDVLIGVVENASSSHDLAAKEDAMRPTYTALAVSGHLDQLASRHLLHWYFVQHHGQHIKGILRMEELPKVGDTDEVPVDKVAGLLADYFEARSGGPGMGLREIALVAMTMQKVMVQEALSQASRLRMEDAPSDTGLNGRLSLAEALIAVEDAHNALALSHKSSCEAMKVELLRLELPVGSGLVPMSALREAGRSSEFNASDLQQAGAITLGPTSESSVIIPNYLSMPSNCVPTAGLRAVCCHTSCSDVQGQLLKSLGRAKAPPSSVIRSLLDLQIMGAEDAAALHDQLSAAAVGDLNGEVHVLGEPSASWLHHAFPRECPLPLEVSHLDAPETQNDAQLMPAAPAVHTRWPADKSLLRAIVAVVAFASALAAVWQSLHVALAAAGVAPVHKHGDSLSSKRHAA